MSIEEGLRGFVDVCGSVCGVALIELVVFFFFFKQKTAYEMLRSLVGSEMCIRDRINTKLAIENQMVCLPPKFGERRQIISIPHPPRRKTIGIRKGSCFGKSLLI